MGDPVKGKRELIGITAGAATLFLLISALAWLRGGEFVLVKDLGRPAVVVGLGILALSRMSWPRIVLCVWLALMAIVSGVASVNGITINVSAGIIMFLITIAWALGALRLYTSPNVVAFMSGHSHPSAESQREESSPPAV